MTKRLILSPETMDGIEYGMRLDTPASRERRAKYWRDRAAHRRAVDALDDESVVACLLGRNANYVESLVRRDIQHSRDILAGLRHNDEIRAHKKVG